MRTEFNAMMETANDKYIKLIDAIYRLKNGSEVDFEKITVRIMENNKYI